MGSIREGLPHLYSTRTPKGNLTPSLSIDQFKSLTLNNQVHLSNITEKTDGMSFVIGWDMFGFYTQHSGSGDDRARAGAEHILRAWKRSAEKGIEYDALFPESMSAVHRALQRNEKLTEWLKNEFLQRGAHRIRGELLNRTMGVPDLFSTAMRFVHTKYDTERMGSLGTFILHTQLEANKALDESEILDWSDKYITFDHDKLECEPCSIDVTDEVNRFQQLDHSLILGRATPTTKPLKVAENDSFNEIKKALSEKVARSISTLGIENKWGPGSEGLVVHPSALNPEAPRFKITSREFQEAKLNSQRF